MYNNALAVLLFEYSVGNTLATDEDRQDASGRRGYRRRSFGATTQADTYSSTLPGG